jgi:P4 family phage/plasmid primase-like protien
VIQIVAQRQFGGSDRAVFVFTNPPLIIPSLSQLFKQHVDLIAQNLPESERVNLFYTVAHHSGTRTASKPQRTSTTFEYQTILPFDIDAADTTAALDYAAAVGKALGCPPQALTVIITGNGVHVIAGLKKPIRDANYFPQNKRAYNLVCEKINSYLKDAELPGHADPVIFEPARVLRLPGTLNQKVGKPISQCILVQYADAVLDLNLEEVSGLKTAAEENVSPGEIRRKYPTPDFQEMVKECRFVHWSIDKISEVHEPQAFDLFSLLAPQVQDATAVLPDDREIKPRQLAEWVFDHATASASLKREDFDKKWEQAKTYGGRKCSTISSHWMGGCETCPHHGKIQTPLALKGKDHIASEVLGYWVMNEKGQCQHPHYEDLAKVYRKETHYVVTAGERVFSFDGQRYVESSDLVIKAWLEAMMRPTEPLREMHRNEFLRKVKTLGSISFIRENELFVEGLKGRLNCRNGILDLRSGDLGPHDPAVGFKYVLPYDYTPGLSSELFLDWLAQITQDRHELMESILDVMAYMLWPNYDDHLFVYLTGEGSNGKSTLIHILQKIVGEGNYSALSTMQLTTNRFAPAQLEGKLVNLSEESSGESISLSEMDILKNLSAGGEITVERKGVDGFNLKNQAKLIFSANKTPRFQDQGHAVTRRLLAIPFDFTIERPDPRIEGTLLSEVPAIVSMLVRRIQENITRNGGRFIVGRGGVAAAEAQKKVLTAGNSVIEWARESIESNLNIPEEKYVVVSEAYAHYTNWCEVNGFKNKMNKINFGRTMREHVITPVVSPDDTVRQGQKTMKIYRRTRFTEGAAD